MDHFFSPSQSNTAPRTRLNHEQRTPASLMPWGANAASPPKIPHRRLRPGAQLRVLGETRPPSLFLLPPWPADTSPSASSFRHWHRLRSKGRRRQSRPCWLPASASSSPQEYRPQRPCAVQAAGRCAGALEGTASGAKEVARGSTAMTARKESTRVV